MISHGQRWQYAFRAFFSLIFHGRLAEDILDAFARTQPADAPVVPADTTDRATQMLAILQRDGRLIDFLMEDLAAYSDEQVGAAVRDVHAGCRASLARYVMLAPVIDDEEGRTITLEGTVDPGRVRVIGHSTGSPVRGVLRHRGWDATRLDLPPLAASSRAIVAPAEVEIA
jgi:hypothetical protein